MAAAIAAMPSFGPGQAVFVPDEDECYVLAKVSAVQGATVTATKKSGDNISTTEAYLHDPYDEEQGDLVQMTNVDPANMLNTLRVRHKAGHAYTNAGQRGIVVSVNPYKWIDICTPPKPAPLRATAQEF
jgi:myosin heavy subunit